VALALHDLQRNRGVRRVTWHALQKCLRIRRLAESTPPSHRSLTWHSCENEHPSCFCAFQSLSRRFM
jgi:hypothetical protein